MAYKIHYGTRKQNRKPGSKMRLFFLSLAFFALLLLFAWRLIPTQMETLRQILLPQDNVDALLKDIQAGESIVDAVSAFCQEILNGK